MGFGALALGTGCFQFWPRWRSRHLKWHRFLGKIYLISVALSGVAAFVAAQNATGGWITRLGFSSLALAWLTAAWVAYRRIRQKRIADHRRWMIRNYALTLAAVALRLWMPLLVAGAHLPFLDAYRTVAWLCWLPNLLLAEWLVRRWPSEPV